MPQMMQLGPELDAPRHSSLHGGELPEEVLREIRMGTESEEKRGQVEPALGAAALTRHLITGGTITALASRNAFPFSS